jgi:HPt (histidine-containing phosphotransfer) domain-containing protein
VRKQAHQIKGAAANVGAERLRSVALEIEKAGKTGDPDAAYTLIPHLERQSAQLRTALEVWMNGTVSYSDARDNITAGSVDLVAGPSQAHASDPYPALPA